MKCSEIEEKHKKFVRDNPEVLAGLEPFLPDSMTASSSSSSMRPSAPEQSELVHSPPTPSVHHQALYGTNSSAREYIVDTINSLPEEMVEEILLKVQRNLPGIQEEDTLQDVLTREIEVDEEDDQATEQPRRRCRQQ